MKKQLKELIVKPALEFIGLYSEDATNLVFETACVESRCGEYIAQYPTGPAKGIFQMEPATARDIYDNFLQYKPELKGKVEALKSEALTMEENLVGNLYYAAAMCRVHYLRQPKSIPSDLKGRAEYWKKYYNTEKGKGTVEKYIEENT